MADSSQSASARRVARARDLIEGRVLEITSRFESGESIKAIAQDVGVGESTIARLLREHGIETKRHPSPFIVKMWVRLYTKSLLSTQEIAKRTVWSQRTVYQHLADLGITRTRQHGVRLALQKRASKRRRKKTKR